MGGREIHDVLASQKRLFLPRKWRIMVEFHHHVGVRVIVLARGTVHDAAKVETERSKLFLNNTNLFTLYWLLIINENKIQESQPQP